MKSWELSGWGRKPDSPGLAAALRNFHCAEIRKPEERDAPPASVLPMTRAAREALRIYRNGGRL